MALYLSVKPASYMFENGSLISPEGLVLFSDAAGQDEQFSGGVQVLLAVLMSLLVLVTVIGNILVILAFAVDKNLRSQNNFFLLNLAFCDLLVGAVCIPLYMPYLLTGRWMIGRVACRFWLVTDYVMCVASAFSVLLISYDRFLSVTSTVMYQANQKNNSQAFLKIALVWILSFLLYGPAIIFWEHLRGASIVPDNQCFSEFYYTWYFLLGASAVDFLFPLISISYFNFSIYWNIHKRSQARRSCAPQIRITIQDEERDMNHYTISGHILLRRKTSNAPEKRVNLASIRCFCTQGPSCIPKRGKKLEKKCSKNTKLSRDKKLAKSLVILVSIFVICWAPYTLLMAIRAACNGFCINSYWYEITFWLLWINSSINPFLYPLCHKSFRGAFNKVLCRKRFTSNRQM
ncbi:histamine H3 receptor-like [Lissotriton helveticus]